MEPVRSLADKTFVLFDAADACRGLPQFCRDLFRHQMVHWTQLREGCSALDSVRVREIACSGFTVKLQWNPQRIVRPSAETDQDQIPQRDCFLCFDHLPEPQQGILYHHKYLLLCNPAPIFFPHLTITRILHVPQTLDASMETMLDLAQDLCPEFTVLYNGQACGAFTPDHLHFHASPWRALPVECDAVDMKRRKRFYYKHHVAGFTLTNYGRTVVVVESSEKGQVLEFVRNMFAEWKKMQQRLSEPRMNVLCSYQEGIWRIIVFPRRKQRSDAFFQEGEHRIFLNPTAVDLGGVIVTPTEKDFLQMDAKLIESIFEEISLEHRAVDGLVESLV
jgi:diadenosine tetraphosphate (Ap4A) HIT family hydrolase